MSTAEIPSEKVMFGEEAKRDSIGYLTLRGIELPHNYHAIIPVYGLSHDFECNLVLISRSKNNKIAWALKARAIYNHWKLYKCLLHQTAREIMLLLVDNIHKKNI